MPRLTHPLPLAAIILLLARCGPRDVDRAEARAATLAAPAGDVRVEWDSCCLNWVRRIVAPADNPGRRQPGLSGRLLPDSGVDIAAWLRDGSPATSGPAVPER